MDKATGIWAASVIAYVAAVVAILLAGEAIAPAHINVALF